MVAGRELDSDGMISFRQASVCLKKLINYRYRLTAADDDLTPRIWSLRGTAIPRELEMDLAGMKDKFYSLVQMDPQKGISCKEILEEYGMAEEARKMW